MDTHTLAAYICGKIDGAPVRPDPFPHCVMEAFWPADFYARLLETLPPEHGWHRRGDYGAGGLTRMASRVQPSAAWMTCYVVLESDMVMQALCRKWNIPSGVNRCLLHKDIQGYGISPHNDSIHKRLAYVLYCASGEETPDQCRELGTHLLVPRAGYYRIQTYQDRHLPWYAFQSECTVPYTPNTLLTWPRTKDSYHAVSTTFAPSDPVQARYSVRGFIFAEDVPLPFIFTEDARQRGLV